MDEFEVVNVVGTIEFNQRIALRPLADSLASCEEIDHVDYDPSDLHLIHSWLSDDNIYVAFYKNGTCSITGVDSLEKLYQVSDKVIRIMQDILDFDPDSSVVVNNVVATTEIADIPPLKAIAIGLGLEQTEYEPELFPAVIYRGGESVILIFASGEIVCTGLRDLDEVSSAIDKITIKINTLVPS
jgi:transcription initiation factor TFIID TATA-box-binding protein